MAQDGTERFVIIRYNVPVRAANGDYVEFETLSVRKLVAGLSIRQLKIDRSPTGSRFDSRLARNSRDDDQPEVFVPSVVWSFRQGNGLSARQRFFPEDRGNDAEERFLSPPSSRACEIISGERRSCGWRPVATNPSSPCPGAGVGRRFGASLIRPRKLVTVTVKRCRAEHSFSWR